MNTASYEKIEKSANRRKTVLNVVVYIFLALWGIMVLFPFSWMVLTSVKSTVPIMLSTFRSSLLSHRHWKIMWTHSRRFRWRSIS